MSGNQTQNRDANGNHSNPAINTINVPTDWSPLGIPPVKANQAAGEPVANLPSDKMKAVKGIGDVRAKVYEPKLS